MTINSGKHVVMFPVHMWGHTRTLCTLAARLVKLGQVTVTFFTVPTFYDRSQAEIAREFAQGDDFPVSRLRLIALEESKEIHDTSGAEASFEIAWSKILGGQPLVCAKTGSQFEPVPVRPSAAVLDLFVRRAFDVVRKTDNVKAYLWFPAATIGMGLVLGAVMAHSRDEETVETLPEIFTSTKGELIKGPFAPPMYDYEYHPQEFPHPPGFAENVLAKVPSMFASADGIITFDAADYAPEITKQLRSYFEETGRKIYYAGPLIPEGEEDTSKDPRSEKISKFLEEKLVSHGERSVIYISFGSVFWPMDNAKLWAVLNVIMERNIPFVLSCVAAFSAKPPAEMQEQIAQYSHGIMTDWVPQQALLAHPATGWYISHGGHNSTLETIMAGIPTIVWPISAEQPLNAIHLSETLDVAFELIEVRHGAGAGKIYRNGRVPIATVDAAKAEMRDVLERAYGEEGERKRANLLSLRKKLQATWEENGIARREVEAFLNEL
ncbi:UDP-Glycosyltransferase/glycogen phosphorylase [Lentinus tigrinus ALCF2SS1-6]|uniref:UDP-Glycosyltransferase/glycogen phosphorylase n=1 Tax=Lentinus tigrinus ALCF2SS1-6 TaxID=1328759 RepID=A0A5C2SDR1_9APHY|nr:UDP-Glycosyltransferase/glycogen phosphorylase [Lentinus tigrinus ALCF2SS1-6]